MARFGWGGGKRYMFSHKYEEIIKLENIFIAWKNFLRGKKGKNDIALFQAKLGDNLFNLYYSLVSRSYEHGPYSAFNISDPKPRNIHKATVRDRLLHRLVYQELYPYFEKNFIYDSYSCRDNKGVHRALDTFRKFARQASKNNSRTCYVLKCDIKKFFASIDHEILIEILKKHIADQNIIWLLNRVISSFHSSCLGVGLPLGNLTSQLFANVYLHELDWRMKRELGVKRYLRYADDFVILSDNKEYLNSLLPKISEFLETKLKLKLHENKVFIKTFASGVDFLGWTHFPNYRQIRTTTKRKIIRKLIGWPKRETMLSYRGLLNHGSAHKLKIQLGLEE
jgi:RNA-directed DNA polymerase